MLRDTFEGLEAKDVGELVIGDLNGIRDKGDHGKSVNQKVNNFWAFNLIERRIRELGQEYGITIRKVSEGDTSKTCCLCGRQHNTRVERGLIVCPETHQSINADVNVAVERSPVLSTPAGTSGSGLLAEPLPLGWNHSERV
jgi:putative transposase